VTPTQIIDECRVRGISLVPTLDIEGDVPDDLAEALGEQTDAVVYQLLRPTVRPSRSPDNVRAVLAFDREMKRTSLPPGQPLPWDCVLWHHAEEVFYSPGPANAMGWRDEG